MPIYCNVVVMRLVRNDVICANFGRANGMRERGQTSFKMVIKHELFSP